MHSEWKQPLRLALNNLANAIDELYLQTLRPYLKDPWQLRHEYYQVLCDRVRPPELIAQITGQKLAKEELLKIEILLAAQYERQRMFTSCGWFFDDFDRIEPRNNIAYAAQAVWLTLLATGVDLSSQAMQWLKPVKSWRSGLRADLAFGHHMERARRQQHALEQTG